MPIKKKLADIIKYLIQNDQTLADDDNRLISNVHYKQLIQKGYNPDGISAKYYLSLVSKGVFYSTESIRRTRQKLQEQYPTLRGRKYKKRHTRAKQVRQHITKVRL